MTQTHISPKRVCVIGAGPSGLVAAKTLLYDHPKGAFEVVVFEKNSSIGGLWPLSKDQVEGMMNPQMRVNISRHTVCFSDFAWPEDTAVFPKAWEVGQYLKRYLDKYSDIEVRTSNTVVSTQRSEGHGGAAEWKVSVSNVSNQITELSFDHVIVASGFFGRPSSHESGSNSKENPDSTTGSAANSSNGPQIKYYCDFRRIEECLNESSRSGINRNIVVVGGSMSGAEVAGAIALQLSSMEHSPEAAVVSDAEKYKVHHIYPRPFWAAPYFLPANPLLDGEQGATKAYNPAPEFIPIDLRTKLDDRPPGPLLNRSGHIKPEAASKAHAFFESLVGSDQTDIGGLNCNPSAAGAGEKAPWMAISDMYSEFVRSGKIVPILGRLSHLPSNGDSVLRYDDKNGQKVISDVAACILATGYDATNVLSYLPDDILARLKYDSKQPVYPMVLDVHSSVSKECPELGFVGFYRGQYWGVIELQARYLGALWSCSSDAEKALATYESDIPKLRDLYNTNRGELAQYPMGDHAYIIENFREILDLERVGNGRVGPILPGRYLPSTVSEDARQQSLKSLSQAGKVLNESATAARFVARAIFRALQGDWKLDRKIASRSEHPSGRLTGTAKFHPRAPTDADYESEYLYIEEGEFETQTGFKFRANRRYAHRYNLVTDTLSIWFTKPDNKSIDYLFHEFEILPPKIDRQGQSSGWRARAHHLCIKDTYDVEYEFVFRGASISRWSMCYDVRGPEKDYRIESYYQR